MDCQSYGSKETHGNPNTSLVKKGRLLPWRTAAECVDLSFDCPSIFKRKKALAPKATLERIVRGILKYIVHNPEPYIVDAAAQFLQNVQMDQVGDQCRSMSL